MPAPHSRPFGLRETLDPGLELQQIRGREGVRGREAYAQASRETGVPWTGRNYDRNNWANSDPINRALSAANAGLYEVRIRCRDAFAKNGLLKNIVEEIEYVLDIPPPDDEGLDYDADPALPGGLWDPAAGQVPGGEQYAPDEPKGENEDGGIDS